MNTIEMHAARTGHSAEERTLAFHLGTFPEVRGGGVLTSPVVTISPSGPTVGTPAVNTAPFDPGGGAAIIPTGKAVLVEISGVSLGLTYTLTCSVLCDGSGPLVLEGLVKGI